MDANIVLVISLITVVGLVIFNEWSRNQEKFEDNEHHRELWEMFSKGFREGLDTENTNNRIYVDDILKRVGFTAPEMVDGPIVKEKEDLPLEDFDNIPPVVLEHETEFDMEELARLADGPEGEAQWVDKSLLKDSPTNTLLPLEPESPPMLRPLTE